jgi:hypothetical protein
MLAAERFDMSKDDEDRERLMEAGREVGRQIQDRIKANAAKDAGTYSRGRYFPSRADRVDTSGLTSNGRLLPWRQFLWAQE